MPARGAESLFVVSERADRQPGDASRLNVEYCPELKEQHDGELMSETRFHGVRSRENTDLQQAINDIDSSVIGIVAVADDADPETFPLNTPVLLTRVRNVLGKAGKTGSLYKALKAISDQCSPRVVIVRVEEASDNGASQSQAVIGGTDGDSYTGMYALLTAEAKTGYPDKTWRQIVTIQDAVNNGWDYTDIDEIRDENSPDEFENLYMCEFVKDGESAFNLSQLLGCGADGYDDWPDWKPFAGRPMGQREVWLGYDANGGSGNGDAGALSITVPPLVPGGRFRTVELQQLRGLEFEQQAAVIKEAAERYNVTHIAIDGQGVGEAVWQIVKNWFPAAICYQMSLSSKRALVLKMLQVIRAGRWEYDRSEQGLVRAFNAVRKVVTPGGFITYETDRSRGVSHGDMAWATMLSIINEPLGQESGGGGFAMGW